MAPDHLLQIATDLAEASPSPASPAAPPAAPAPPSRWPSGDISAPTTLAVRVLATAHSGSKDVTSATRPVSPTPGTAAIASPAILTAATLNNATLTVSLERTTYASGVTAASFELVTEGIADAARAIASATATAGGTSATLTLASSGMLGANATLAVKALPAALRPTPQTG